MFAAYQKGYNLFSLKRKNILALCTLILVFLSNTVSSFAQEEFILPPSREISSFTFTLYTGGVIMIRGKLDDYPDSLNFILDTGSGGISLDSGTCIKYHINTEKSDKTIRGIAGIRNVRFVYNRRLHLPGLTVDSLNFHVNDYDILTSVYGDKIDGIIGYTFFNRYIVKIDYDSMRLSIYSRGPIKYPKGGFLLKPVLANLPVQAARVRDAIPINARFYFDTGAGLCMLLSTDFITDSSLLKVNKKFVATQAEGLGGKTDMRLTTVKEVKLGPYKFRNVPTYVFDDDFNVTSYPYLGGLLGNDLLRRFNLIINYDRRDIYLMPNSHYRDPFDYSYTGLGIYWVNGEIRVGDIMKDSPAEKAGFQLGDIVIAVDNNFTKNIQAYKTLLQNVGNKVQVVILRNSGPQIITMRVKSIL